MELNWSTFVLEIVNFLVLVWILKHFLYKPVLEVIARRRGRIEKTLADAEARHADAESLREQYQGRLAIWDQERQQAREALADEIEVERAANMTKLQGALRQEREKMRVAEARRQADTLRKIEETALVQAAKFASRLLQQAAGPDTQARLVDMLIAELSQLPAMRITSMRNTYAQTADAILVVSAFPIADDQRRRLEPALVMLSAADAPVRYEQDSELIAGVRITIGAWVLGANLRDELKGFSELADGE